MRPPRAALTTHRTRGVLVNGIGAAETRTT
jgi:hypothetical protein